MLFAAPIALEVRTVDGVTRLSGAFPYNTETVLGDGRRERFAAGAFRSRIDNGENIFLLSGHDPEKPLAATRNGTLTLRSDDAALHIEARVSATTSWARDAVAALAEGLSTGLSPGFRVPSGGDVTTRSEGGLLRTVNRAELYEVSLVTRPAYDAAQVQARSWKVDPHVNDALHRLLKQWRV